MYNMYILNNISFKLFFFFDLEKPLENYLSQCQASPQDTRHFPLKFIKSNIFLQDNKSKIFMTIKFHLFGHWYN